MESRSPKRIGLCIGERIVHPAHVPLEVEAETAVRRGLRDHGPRRRFLCDHHRVRESGKDLRVEAAEKRHGVDVLFSAVFVGSPLLSAVVEIEHTRNRVHSESVHVENVEPIHRVGYKEARHLAALIVEAARAPFLVLHSKFVRGLI